jgi:chromate reductase
VRILAVAGSLQSRSGNLELLSTAAAAAPEGVLVVLFDGVRDLPLFNPDLEPEGATPPPAVQAWRDALRASDGVLIASPEYGHSLPGALKNAIDWASRPYGKNSFARKPSATIGTSPGKIGTAVAQQHLKSILSFCNSPQMNAIEAYIQFTPGLFTDDGDVTDASTKEFLSNYVKEFAGFIGRVYTVIPRQSA